MPHSEARSHWYARAASSGRVARRLTIAVGAAAVVGCSATSGDLPYYWQSARGHMALMGQAQPIAELLESGSLDLRLRSKLERVHEIRGFASRTLGLPDNGSFTRYAALERPFVVWNVFATPELSLQLKQWCFPVAGCVGYRGYFDRADAERHADELRAQGWDVHVAGVPAYSTLGWFDDPVLSTFIHYPDGELARLIFHELAHQVVYVKDDSTFNESFATAVEEAGVRRWLAEQRDPAIVETYERFAQRRQQFVALLRRHKAALEDLYRQGGPDRQLREGKAAIFAALRADYQVMKAQWGGYPGYDRWFSQSLTNAHLASVSTYTALLPAFRRLLDASGGDLPKFFGDARALARLDKADRDRRLAAENLAAERLQE